jgi:hypothetical protein
VDGANLVLAARLEEDRTGSAWADAARLGTGISRAARLATGGDAARLHKSARRGFTRGRGSGFRKVARVGSGRGAGLRSDLCARGFGFRISGGAAAAGGPATAASLGDGYRLAFRLRLRRIEAARLGWLTGWLRTREGDFDLASGVRETAADTARRSSS